MSEHSGQKPISRCYKDVFDSPDGIRVLQHICNVADVFNTTASVDNNGRIDSNQVVLKEGARRLALSILRQVNSKNLTLNQMDQYYGQ